MQYRNGCTRGPGCAGEPTHIYKPQGGFPIGYCAMCAPSFLKKTLHTLPTTAAYAAITERVIETISVEPEPLPEPEVVEEESPDPDPEPAPETEDQAAEKETVEEPKPRRTRRKKTAPAPDTDE